MKRSPLPAPPVPELSFRPAVPIDGPFAQFLAGQQANLDVVRNARDLRSEPRRRIDNVWTGAEASCLERFGRAPSFELWEQPSDSAAAALSIARNYEADLLRLQHAGASPGVVDAAFDLFCSAAASWLNAATSGWPDRKRYERQVAREAKERYT